MGSIWGFCRYIYIYLTNFTINMMTMKKIDVVAIDAARRG
jgi:hypothetical protein